jgi:hypothetical protein
MQFEDAFSSLNEWALSGSYGWSAVGDFASQNRDLIRRRSIGQPLVCAVARVLRPLPEDCFESILGWPVFALHWRLKLASQAPNWTDYRLSWEERVRTALPVYRVVLRGLREWIESVLPEYTSTSTSSAVLEVANILELPILVAAYVLLRRRVEGQWFSLHSSIDDVRISEPPIPLATRTSRYQRLICADLYLGMYVDCVCILRDAKTQGTDFKPDFNLRSGLEVFLIRRQEGSHSTGSVILPGLIEPEGRVWSRATRDLQPLVEMHHEVNDDQTRI